MPSNLYINLQELTTSSIVSAEPGVEQTVKLSHRFSNATNRNTSKQSIKPIRPTFFGFQKPPPGLRHKAGHFESKQALASPQIQDSSPHKAEGLKTPTHLTKDSSFKVNFNM